MEESLKNRIDQNRIAALKGNIIKNFGKLNSGIILKFCADKTFVEIKDGSQNSKYTDSIQLSRATIDSLLKPDMDLILNNIVQNKENNLAKVSLIIWGVDTKFGSDFSKASLDQIKTGFDNNIRKFFENIDSKAKEFKKCSCSS